MNSHIYTACMLYYAGCLKPTAQHLYSCMMNVQRIHTLSPAVVSHNHEPALDAYPEHQRLNEAQKTEVTKFFNLGISPSFTFTCSLNCTL